MPTWARRTGFALALGAIVLTAAHAVAVAIPLQLTQVGGVAGSRYETKAANAVYEATEDVAFDFDSPVDLDSFRTALAVEPATASRVEAQDFGKRVLVELRKTPGVTYHLHIAAGVRALDGSTLPSPADAVVRTAVERVPAPLRPTPNEPYRYGVLAHPYPFSLGGPNASRIVGLLADAGVRFVRIDYCGDQIEPDSGRFNFSIEDRIADQLAAHGITELPIVNQYCAPKWANGGFGYPAIWEDPTLYAQYAAAVAAHVAARYPHVGRIEIFNEPNLTGWWTNDGDAEFAPKDGSAAARYMLAAYAAIKTSAPRLTIVGPALASGGHDIDPRTYFETLYANGCRRGACWDVLSVHNYRWVNPTFPIPATASNRWDVYRDLVAIATRHGDANTHVMLTEWGFSTIDSTDGVDPQTQALYVALGFNEMLADPLVDGIVYVNMYNPATDFWGQTALVSVDFTPKPAYFVYRTFALDTR